MVRECANWRPGCFPRVMRWPLRDLFQWYLAILCERARQEYQASLVIWAIQQSVATKAIKPPDVPEVLSN
jgi:hypothetical protein